MNKSVLISAMGLAAVFGAQAQEVGRVLSTTPVIQQVAVPRQVCNQQQVMVQQPNSGAGGLMGAIAGGAMGNAIGDGSGRAAATIIGLVGGAVLGNRIEGSGNQVQNVQQCGTQTFYENRTVAYNVTYEYAGRQYTVQMPQDPGPTMRLQVTPIGAVSTDNAPAYAYADQQPQPLQQQQQPVIVSSNVVQPVATYPGVVIQQPYYRPYYAPIGMSFNFGYSRGGYGHGPRGHWR